MEREKNIGFDGKNIVFPSCGKIRAHFAKRKETEFYLKLCMDFSRETDYNNIRYSISDGDENWK